MNESVVRQACEKVFDERKKFLIIGLTGRTGSGCSTAANLLSKENFDCLLAPAPHSSSTFEIDIHRKYNICFNYLKDNWHKFHHIKLSNIISSFILDDTFCNLKRFVSKYPEISLDGFEDFFNSFKEGNGLNPDSENCDDFVKFHTSEIDEFTEKLKKALGSKQSSVLQEMGNNVRKSNSPYSSEFNPNSLYAIPEKANKIIKALRIIQKKDSAKKVFVCLDAIRNPFEAFFFRERYASFYLISIATEENNRKFRLRKDRKYNDEQIRELDETECPDKPSKIEYFTSLSVNRCIEVADIHINNPQDNGAFSDLKKQLVKYLALMMHPGLIPPSKSERCMQVAHDARLNSGCISRQVGAVIANTDYSVMAVGWNTTPQGQTPCSLRDARDLLSYSDDLAFSDYEKKNEDFRNQVAKIFQPLVNSTGFSSKPLGRPICFCFKDVHNSIKGDKNQVHTRALHAEENAFLQISKRGVEKIQGGILFTTASPCELCSKKAYQLGISKIYFIDPYPGIAEDQILKSGTQRPCLEIFTGAIGRAYQQLYQPILPYKDEMELYFGINSPKKPYEVEMDELKERVEAMQKEIDELRNKASSDAED